jgi:hypothetical protein
VLSATGRIDFPVHLFANVGDDSENPDTLDYVRNVSMPYAKAHGVELVEIHRIWRDGRETTLRAHLMRPNHKGVGIPMYGTNGAPLSRYCTTDWKIGPILKWLRAHGATRENPALSGIGISVDEIERASNRDRPIQRVCYPLIELGLRRMDCYRIIAEAGLPRPPKSSCYFCPFHRVQTWAEQRRDRPDLFERAAELEDQLVKRSHEEGMDPVYLTKYRRPIREAVGPAQTPLFDPDALDGPEACDEGVCFV